MNYKEIEDSIIFRPFDLEDRNEFYKEVGYLNTQRGVEAEIERLYKENKLSEECRFYYELLINLFNLKLTIVSETPFVVNSELSRQVVQVENYYWLKLTEKIIELTPELADYSNFKKSVSEVLVMRNNVMAENILNYVNEFRGKRLVVLVGAEHRYYLHKNLVNRQEENNFILKEFWEY